MSTVLKSMARHRRELMSLGIYQVCQTINVIWGITNFLFHFWKAGGIRRINSAWIIVSEACGLLEYFIIVKKSYLSNHFILILATNGNHINLSPKVQIKIEGGLPLDKGILDLFSDFQKYQKSVLQNVCCNIAGIKIELELYSGENCVNFRRTISSFQSMQGYGGKNI